MPTYLIGGRGYWSHPQVVELVCYLRALANPRDEEALYATWCSPLCGFSLDALVLLARVSARGRPVAAARDPDGRLDALDATIASGSGVAGAERRAAARIGAEELAAPRDRAHRLRAGRAGAARWAAGGSPTSAS